MKKYTRFIQGVIVIVIVVNVSTAVYQNREKYTSTDYWQRFRELERAYTSSQYANKNPSSSDWIPDEVAFAYAGGAYIKGINPVLVIPDAPPLGKYLIGLSVLLFNNENIITTLVFAPLSLFLLYRIGLQVLRTKTLALLPPLFFSLETMFTNQFRFTPLFDIAQLTFLLAIFYFLNTALIKRTYWRYFIFASLFLGFFIATKFFISGVPVVAALLSAVFFQRDKRRLLSLILALPISIVTLLASYARVFAFGYTLRSFLGIQKWVFVYHQGQLVLPLSVWPLLLFNQWYVWFGDKPVISDPQWRVSWPLITIASFVTTLLYVSGKIGRKKEMNVVILWSVFYVLFLSFGQVFSRYFIILIPLFYVIITYGVEQLIIRYVAAVKSFKK